MSLLMNYLGLFSLGLLKDAVNKKLEFLSAYSRPIPPGRGVPQLEMNIVPE